MLPLHLRRLQPIAQRHQLVDLGHDAVLFGEWRDGHRKEPQPLHAKPFSRNANLLGINELLVGRRREREMKETTNLWEKQPNNGDVLRNVAFGKVFGHHGTPTD